MCDCKKIGSLHGTPHFAGNCREAADADEPKLVQNSQKRYVKI